MIRADNVKSDELTSIKKQQNVICFAEVARSDERTNHVVPTAIPETPWKLG